MSKEQLEVLAEARQHLKRYANFCKDHLGDTSEKQDETICLFKGLTSDDVRAALREYREKHHLG